MFLSVRMIEFNHLSYEKIHDNFKKNYAGFIKLRRECLNSIKLGAKFSWKVIEIQSFFGYKNTHYLYNSNDFSNFLVCKND